MSHKHVVLYLLAIIVSYSVSAQELISNKMVWRGNSYAAFTTLVYYKGFFYCAFRDANLHYDTSGKDCGGIKIIRSSDGEKWEEYLVFTDEGIDLRDPQLTITPDNKILLLAEKVKYKDGKVIYRGSCSAFINEKKILTSLTPIIYTPTLNGNWLWNITWIDGDAYGFTYCPCFSFVKSRDGKNYQVLKTFEFDGVPTEASIIKWKRDLFIAVIRRDRSTALLGIYDRRRNEWTWNELQEKVDCPHLIRVKGDVYLLGRSYGEKTKTTVYRLNENSFSLKKIIDLGGKSDCAYPGAVYKKGKMYISYYSGEGRNGDIYFAVIKL